MILRVGSALSFATMTMLIKLAAAHGAALPQIILWRQAVPVPAILCYLWLTGGLGKLRTQRIGSHARRAVLGMLGMVTSFASVMLLPLAEATTLGFTAPLFVVLVSSLFLREHVGPWRWTAVLLGLAGVIIVAQPGGEPVSVLGVILGLMAALVVAVISFLIREMAKTEDSISIVFYFSIFGALMAACLLPFYPVPMPGPGMISLLVGLGLAGAMGQLLMTASLRHGAVTAVIVLDYSQLIWATFYGWWVWNLLPSAATWLGAPLVIGAGVMVAWREHRLGKERDFGPAEA